MKATLFPKALFISHGGGPLPLLGDPQHQAMVECLQALGQRLPKPRAIVVVSAHWEQAVPTISAAANPGLLYDYYGFPPPSYEITWPCPGAPELAIELQQRLVAAGFPAELDTVRGLDHGVFIPLKIMYPAADIPCLQVSLLKDLDPALHIKLGSALQHLYEQEILVVGSGFTFHNMRAFFTPETAASHQLNRDFEDWLAQVCSSTALSEAERSQRLIAWAQAPGARFCHPREEHLLPLHVCYGAVQGPCVERMELSIAGKIASLYLW